MKPWNIDANNEEMYFQAWKSFLSSDFYFAVLCEKELGTTLVFIVPQEYFNKERFMLDNSIPLDRCLPEIHLVEIEPSVFRCKKDMPSVRRLFMEAGFIWNAGFQNFVHNHCKTRKP